MVILLTSLFKSNIIKAGGLINIITVSINLNLNKMWRKNYPINFNEPLSSVQIPNIHEARKSQQIIQSLTEELNQANKKNEEFKKLIDILTDDRDYYQGEFNRSQHEKMLLEQAMGKYRIEMDSKNFLINQLKKDKRSTEEQNFDLKQKLEQQRFLFNAQEQLLERITKQKEIIESEWNKELKNVKKKMMKMTKRQDQEDKENMEIFSNLPLQHRVKRVIKKLDKEIKDVDESLSSINDSKRNQIIRQPSTDPQISSDFSV